MHNFVVFRQTRLAAMLISLLLMLVPAISFACDFFNGTDLTIPQVIVGRTLYTNVVVRVGLANVHNGGVAIANPSAAHSPDLYDINTGLLTIQCVLFQATTFTNVIVAVGVPQVSFVGGSAIAPITPTLVLVFPLRDAVVGDAFTQNLVLQLEPPITTTTYTMGIDTLVNGVTPTGMTINQGGTLSGTPFATGAADINARQIAKTYTFGVCATDTLSRNVTSPCPQTTIIVRPVNITATIVGSGTVTPSVAGNSCGTNCYAGYAKGASVSMSASPSAGSTFTGWSGPSAAGCTGTGACVLSASGSMAVTATFTAVVTQGSVSGSWSGTANQPGAPFDGCAAQTASFSMQLTEDASHHITGATGGGVQIAGTRTGNTLTVTETTNLWGSFGPYTWTWNGANTLTGSALYYCYDLGTSALLSSSTAPFTLTRN